MQQHFNNNKKILAFFGKFLWFIFLTLTHSHNQAPHDQWLPLVLLNLSLTMVSPFQFDWALRPIIMISEATTWLNISGHPLHK